ncbi:MAG: Fe(3+) ABC transporter substrate-binding protein [Burkholderiaceae bacterium]|jgi:iron(III) transport system substrate-binding protein|nr:Fe(3+) ABC transporter substrate-binding protein [Burkholderiaceae bacterium]
MQTLRTPLKSSERWLDRGLRAVVTAALVGGSLSVWHDAHAQSSQGAQVLNLYSARHYQTDEALYENFTKQTGIRLNRIELGDEPLLQRLRSEGANSPADVILLVDAARLWRAQIDGLFQPVQSKTLESQIPAALRANDGSWFGFSTRARVIVYNKATVKAEDVDTYEELAEPKNAGKVCTRSGSHPYMLSLIGAMVERSGEAATEKWAKGMVANMARAPKGGDTDQIRAVASGECGAALTNTYYWVRLMRSTDPKDKEVVSKVGFVWPNQQGSGTHVNISGGGVAKHAPNRANAVRFLEYLASPQAQAYFANGNNEWPVVKGAELANPELASLGKFKVEDVPISSVGKGQIAAQRILDRVGYR